MSPWARIGLDLAAYLDLPLGARIAVAAAPYLGWGYDLATPAVAYESGSVPAYLVARRSGATNCSTLSASVLMAVYPLAPWTQREYADLQVFADRFRPGADYHPQGDSPIAAVERVGVGRAVAGWVAGSWHLAQGWRTRRPPAGGGHAMLILPTGDRLQVLAAGTARGVELTSRTPTELGTAYPLLHRAELLP